MGSARLLAALEGGGGPSAWTKPAAPQDYTYSNRGGGDPSANRDRVRPPKAFAPGRDDGPGPFRLPAGGPQELPCSLFPSGGTVPPAGGGFESLAGGGGVPARPRPLRACGIPCRPALRGGGARAAGSRAAPTCPGRRRTPSPRRWWCRRRPSAGTGTRSPGRRAAPRRWASASRGRRA